MSKILSCVDYYREKSKSQVEHKILVAEASSSLKW